MTNKNDDFAFDRMQRQMIEQESSKGSLTLPIVGIFLVLLIMWTMRATGGALFVEYSAMFIGKGLS